MKKTTIIISIIVILLIFIGFIYFNKQKNNNIDNDNIDVSDIPIIDNFKNIAEVDYSKLEKFDIKLTDTLQIKKGGVYYLEGTIDDGQIYIDTNDNVKLVLNNVNIINKTGPAIMVENANQVYIELASESVNYLTDGEDYEKDESGEPDGVIFSKDDLIIGGTGKLVINANYADGIVSKDSLKIMDGIYEINSSDDAIRGKDSLVITDGSFMIESSGDGIKTTNDKDSNLGYILIENGDFNIISINDGIEAETDLVINNGTFNIQTGGSSSNSSLENENWGFWGKSPDNKNITNSSNQDSAKGIKASNSIIINNGDFTIDSSDDAIHSNESVGIVSGNLLINSGDDGIHADKEIIIDDGNIIINKSYEGIEAESITINNGMININASDDGINAAGGNDASSINNRPGMNNFENSGNAQIGINGGNIYVNAQGDGIDANGSIYMTNGIVIVNGPVDNGNGAIDYDKEFKITGGTFLASGSNGMVQNLSNSSTQNSIMISFSKTINADELISIFDSKGKEIITYKASKNYQNLVISSPNLKLNETYTIYIGGNSTSEETNGLYSTGNYKNGEEYTTYTISNIISNIGGNTMSPGMDPGKDNLKNGPMMRR